MSMPFDFLWSPAGISARTTELRYPYQGWDLPCKPVPQVVCKAKLTDFLTDFGMLEQLSQFAEHLPKVAAAEKLPEWQGIAASSHRKISNRAGRWCKSIASFLGRGFPWSAK